MAVKSVNIVQLQVCAYFVGLSIIILTTPPFPLMNSETEASAIHCVPFTRFQPDRVFMICDAGGSTIVCYLVRHWSALNSPSRTWLPTGSLVLGGPLKWLRCACDLGRTVDLCFWTTDFVNSYDRVSLATQYTWMKRVWLIFYSPFLDQKSCVTRAPWMTHKCSILDVFAFRIPVSITSLRFESRLIDYREGVPR